MHHAKFTRVFSAAHRVWNDPGKCSNVHGHNYWVEVVVGAEDLNAQNFVVPFDAIKKAVDDYDHTLIVDKDDPLIEIFRATGLEIREVDGVPSTEFLAQTIAYRIFEAVMPRGTVAVELKETEGITAFGRAG